MTARRGGEPENAAESESEDDDSKGVGDGGKSMIDHPYDTSMPGLSGTTEDACKGTTQPPGAAAGVGACIPSSLASSMPGRVSDVMAAHEEAQRRRAGRGRGHEGGCGEHGLDASSQSPPGSGPGLGSGSDVCMDIDIDGRQGSMQEGATGTDSEIEDEDDGEQQVDRVADVR